MTATTVLIIPKQRMIRLLHDQPALSDRFIRDMLARNIRIEFNGVLKVNHSLLTVIVHD
jgi:hypothetical protein